MFCIYLSFKGLSDILCIKLFQLISKHFGFRLPPFGPQTTTGGQNRRALTGV
jgi:hypothetical protein